MARILDDMDGRTPDEAEQGALLLEMRACDLLLKIKSARAKLEPQPVESDAGVHASVKRVLAKNR